MVVVGALFLIVQFVYADYVHKSAKVEMVAGQDKEIEISLLQARRAEKDFLKRKDEKYVKKHAKAVGETALGIERVSTLLEENFPEDYSLELKEPFNKLESGLSAYVAKFAELNASVVKLGLDETSGLQGELRAAVKAAEGDLAKLN